jgi:hypothetical protein
MNVIGLVITSIYLKDPFVYQGALGVKDDNQILCKFSLLGPALLGKVLASCCKNDI